MANEGIYEAPRDTSQPLKVRGVGRVSDEPRALLVLLNERPTDDELRSIDGFLHEWPKAPKATGLNEQLSVSRFTLDLAITVLRREVTTNQWAHPILKKAIEEISEALASEPRA